MFKNYCVVFVMVIFLCSNCFGIDKISITQKKSGRTISITPLSLTEDKITFKLKGKKRTIPLASIDAASQKAVEEWHAKTKTDSVIDPQKIDPQKINSAIGHLLFSSKGSIWNEDVVDVAKRLNWKQESFTKRSTSFRHYTADKYGFLNAHPYCCTLYADKNGNPSHISIVFANKGDYVSNVGKNHFQPKGDLPSPKDLQGAIERDVKAITNVLTEALGKPKQQRYGEKENRRKVLRWDYQNHAFILSQRDQEYTHLVIVSTDIADKEGKVKYVKDQDLKVILKNGITKDTNGDIYLGEIPMVNQGPKGYCVPATFERAMRYMLIPADMYLLATLATEEGGGTNTSLLVEKSKRIIRSKARRIKELKLSKKLSMRLISKYINRGVPILWKMASLIEYNRFANKCTKARKQTKDFKAWAKKIAEQSAKLAPTLEADSRTLEANSRRHICMIIGYNSETKEVAVSDSWGPAYALRWVHIDVVKAVTHSGGFVIDL